jgi:hypothetical protein
MLPRERVLAALNFNAPDVVPVMHHSSPGGLYEHGEGLKELWRRYPHDFGDNGSLAIPKPGPEWIDESGRYCELRRDEWGVLWRHLIFGVSGHPLERPLDDWAGLACFKAPPAPLCEGEAFRRDQAGAREHMQTYFLLSGWISIFEVMHAVRRFEDVLMDIEADCAEINRLADIIAEYREHEIRHLLERGVDAVQFADDFGMTGGLMLSRKTWRRFFMPRYARLMKPVRDAGKKVFYHSCGLIWELLEDLREIGVDAIWPQVSLYDERAFAARCRDLKLAVALHPDRGDLMMRGKPEDVVRTVERLTEVFEVPRGGAWFHVEIDPGFPFGNVKALIETIGRMREPQGVAVRPRGGRRT